MLARFQHCNLLSSDPLVEVPSASRHVTQMMWGLRGRGCVLRWASHCWCIWLLHLDIWYDNDILAHNLCLSFTTVGKYYRLKTAGTRLYILRRVRPSYLIKELFKFLSRRPVATIIGEYERREDRGETGGYSSTLLTTIIISRPHYMAEEMSHITSTPNSFLENILPLKWVLQVSCEICKI